jgi:putative nucleotidyltransferase with HDIG domain
VVKKVFLEEVIDRDGLKRFLEDLFQLTGLRALPLNDRCESLFGDPAEVLTENLPTDMAGFNKKDLIRRPDGTAVKILPLHWNGHAYGLVLIGPFVPANGTPKKSPAGTTFPVMTSGALAAAFGMIERFFQQQVEVAMEHVILNKKEKILSVLEEASNIMNSGMDFTHLLEFLMDIAIDITGATSGALLLKKERKRYLEVAVARGDYPQEVKKIRVPIGKGITGWVAKAREPLVVPNVLLEPRYIETPESIYSEMAVPLTLGSKLVGVISVDSTQINAFSKDDCTTLSTLASMVTKVLENARLLSESNQKVREISSLFAVSENLSENHKDPELFQKIMEQIAQALSCRGVSIMHYDSDAEDLTLTSSMGLPDEVKGLKIPLGKGIHGWVAAQRKPLLVPDITLETTIVRQSILDQFSRSSLCVPLTLHDRLMGVLATYQKIDDSQFTDNDLNLLTAIGRQLATHEDNSRLFEDSRRKLEYFTTLYKVSSSVSKTLNVSRLFNMILQQVQDVMNVENCSIMAYDPIKNYLTLDAALGIPQKFVGSVKVKIGEGISGMVALNREPCLIKDIAKDGRFSSHSSRLDYKTRSALSVPILHNQTLLGVLNVNNKRSGGIFTEDDLNLLLGISGQISQAVANASLHERTEQQVAELSLLQELGKAVNSSLDLDSVLNYFIDMTSRITDSDRSTLMLFKEETQELYVQAFRGFEDSKIKGLRFKLGEGVAGMVAQTRKTVKILNTHEDQRYKKLAVSQASQPLALISAPLLNKDQLIGVINCERDLGKKGPYTQDNLDFLETLASQATVAIENARLYHNLLNVYLETIRALAAAIDAKDSYTHGHSRRVTDLSVAIARFMHLSRDEVDSIRHAALLHDVGKIGISEQILLKPGRLTDDEFETIKSHPHIGAAILNSIEFLRKVCMIIEHHHERYDGRGYPSGLKAEEIPLGARIIMVADSFDAITSSRPYRKPLSFDEATAEIVRCGGSQFDPVVVEAFQGLRGSPFCPPWLVGEYLSADTDALPFVEVPQALAK